jgi:hypothetical protein
MASFGESLKRERELREISLRDIADATKINIRYLEALEHDRFETLPGGVFNKGFIRAYARFIGANGEALNVRIFRRWRRDGRRGAAPTPSQPGCTGPRLRARHRRVPRRGAERSDDGPDIT